MRKNTSILTHEDQLGISSKARNGYPNHMKLRVDRHKDEATSRCGHTCLISIRISVCLLDIRVPYGYPCGYPHDTEMYHVSCIHST